MRFSLAHAVALTACLMLGSQAAVAQIPSFYPNEELNPTQAPAVTGPQYQQFPAQPGVVPNQQQFSQYPSQQYAPPNQAQVPQYSQHPQGWPGPQFQQPAQNQGRMTYPAPHQANYGQPAMQQPTVNYQIPAPQTYQPSQANHWQTHFARPLPSNNSAHPYQDPILPPPSGSESNLPLNPQPYAGNSPEVIGQGQYVPDQSVLNGGGYHDGGYYDGGYYDGGFYGGGHGEFGHSYFDGYQDGAFYGECSGCGSYPCHCHRRRRGGWFGGAAGLIMARDYESNVYLSYYNSDPRNNIITSRSTDLGAIGGVQVSFGSCLCAGWSWAITYWGLPKVEDSFTATGMPDTRLYGLQMVNYTPSGFGADNAWNWYNNSVGHRVIRSNEFHNIELAFFQGGCCTAETGCDPCCARTWKMHWSVGARYFRFDEFFQYASTVPGGYVNNPRELYYNINTENNLFGLQAGGGIEHCVRKRLSVYAGSKLGLYNNYVEYDQWLIGPSGYATINQGSYNGYEYRGHANKNDIAFIGELDAGMHYQFSKCWRATFGYRVMAATGVALAPNQIPNNFSYLPELNYIKTDGSLILHGAYLGLEFKR